MIFRKIFGDARARYYERQERKFQEKAAEQKQDEATARLLDEYTIPKLDKFLSEYLNRTPESEHDGAKRKTVPTRKDYVRFALEYIKSNEITYAQLKNYAVRERVVSPSFFGIKEEGVRGDFDGIVNSIKTGFEPGAIMDEKELESQLKIYLQAKFPDRKIMQQVKTHGNIIPDILVDDVYAIELKVPSSRAHLRNLGAQLEEYQEQYPNICAVIFHEDGSDLVRDIADYVDRFRRNYNIPSIVLNGKKRRQ